MGAKYINNLPFVSILYPKHKCVLPFFSYTHNSSNNLVSIYIYTLLPCALSWALEVIELYTTQSSLSSWGDASFFAHFLFVLLPVQPKDAVA